MKYIITDTILAAVIITSSFLLSNEIAQAYTPPGRSGWEKHNTSPWEIGAQSTILQPNPTLVLTGTDWWWSRSFVFNGVYILNSGYGAVGVGPSKYIPTGQTYSVYSDLKYDWNSAKQQYGYTFGSGQTDTLYKVYKDTINSGCWWRYAGSMGYDNYFCVSGFIQGHPSFQATTNTASNANPHNTIAGTYSTNKYEDPNTGWQSFGSDNGGKYCSESGTSPYKVQDVNGDESTLNVGSTATSQSCSGIIDGSVYSLPG